MNAISANNTGLPDASLHIIRDMILLALDATEAPNLPEIDRLGARAALAEALDILDGEVIQ